MFSFVGDRIRPTSGPRQVKRIIRPLPGFLPHPRPEFLQQVNEIIRFKPYSIRTEHPRVGFEPTRMCKHPRACSHAPRLSELSALSTRVPKALRIHRLRPIPAKNKTATELISLRRHALSSPKRCAEGIASGAARRFNIPA